MKIKPKKQPARPGRWVFTPYIVRKDGQVIYPRNAKVFRFWVAG